VPWVQTSSPGFTARHDSGDADDAVEVLELLEGTRERLGGTFPHLPGDVAVILHGSEAQLNLAQPYLPLVRRLTAPAGRRYLAGWSSAAELHVLAPRLLSRRASNVAGSREMLLLTPGALYAQLVIAANNPRLPPPFGPASFVRYLRWAWLAAGAAQFFSGQTSYARPAIARRLREGEVPRFPPGVPDAALLGGTVFDLLAAERDEQAAVRLACRLPAGGSRQALADAFPERSLAATEEAWREHLDDLAGVAGA